MFGFCGNVFKIEENKPITETVQTSLIPEGAIEIPIVDESDVAITEDYKITEGGAYKVSGTISREIAISGGTKTNPVKIYIDGKVTTKENLLFNISGGYVDFIGVNKK